MASKHLSPSSTAAMGYVQGAGDDCENWGHGLTPSMFWKHKEEIMRAADQGDSNLRKRIEECVELERKRPPKKHDGPTRIRYTPIWIGIIDQDDAEMLNTTFDKIIFCGNNSNHPHRLDPKKTIGLNVGIGKIASRNLREYLPGVLGSLKNLPLWNGISYVNGGVRPKILVMCENGRDISVGVALALSCKLSMESNINKAAVKRHLAQITISKPDASPSRATLNSIHDVLLRETAMSKK